MFALILLSFSSVLEIIIHKNTKHKRYLIQEDWHCLQNKNYSILLIGNSRVWTQLDTKKISQALNKKAYTLGQDGRHIDVLWAKFKTYIKDNEKPDQVFLQFDPYFISKGLTKKTFFGKENYLSYLFFDRLGINHVFKDDYGYHWYDEYLPLVRYVGYKRILFSHILGKLDSRTDTSGFQYGSMIQTKLKESPTWKSKWENPLSTDLVFYNIAYVDSFIIYCNKNKIDLHLFYPPQSWPSYKMVSQKNIVDLNNYAKSKKTDYYNFNDIKYNDSTLFYNHTHLNFNGIPIFTEDFLNYYFKTDSAKATIK